LSAWRIAFDNALHDEFADCQKIPAAILPAVVDTVQRFHIPSEHLTAVINGVAMDLEPRYYETFDELQPYCERVASAVGLACIHIWGFRGPEAFEPARQTGIALQLTNILRDIHEDAQHGRVYLPLADLRQHHYSVEDLRVGIVDDRFRQLMADEIARAEQFYADGAALLDWLEPDGRRIFGLMTESYHVLLRAIAARPVDVFCRRIRPSRIEKLRLLLRWTFIPPRKLFL
jgi:phytoene synthase